MIANVPPSWRAALAPALADPGTARLEAWLGEQEAQGRTIYPVAGQRLRALELTPLPEVSVVLLGQDPYHGPGQAHGLSFSVPEGTALPRSLANIYAELSSDLARPAPLSGNLESWARQGVLLLNTCLTVEAGRAGSHAKRGWEQVTDAIIGAVAAREMPSVFILWGRHAQAKAKGVPALAESTRHLVLQSAHPSPLSARRGFFGSRPFSKANAFLAANGRRPIDW